MKQFLPAQLPWVSLGLLLASYAGLGWAVASVQFPRFVWLGLVCQQSFSLLLRVSPFEQKALCDLIVQQNLLGAILAIGWILMASAAFMSPLTSFSRFISRWFKSDTIAFLSVFLLAGVATLTLFLLQVFLQILTILAAEALARIDIQTRGANLTQAFWLLTIDALLGLSIGWTARLVF
jgi:hypothetical protein